MNQNVDSHGDLQLPGTSGLFFCLHYLRSTLTLYSLLEQFLLTEEVAVPTASANVVLSNWYRPIRNRRVQDVV